ARRAEGMPPPPPGRREVVGCCSAHLLTGGTAVRCTCWARAAIAALLLIGSGAMLADTGKKPAREDSSFGSLKGPDPAEVRKQAEAWLKSVKADAATLARFKTIWETDRPVLDRVTQVLALGDAQAAKLLREAQD